MTQTDTSPSMEVSVWNVNGNKTTRIFVDIPVAEALVGATALLTQHGFQPCRVKQRHNARAKTLLFQMNGEVAPEQLSQIRKDLGGLPKHVDLL